MSAISRRTVWVKATVACLEATYRLKSNAASVFPSQGFAGIQWPRTLQISKLFILPNC